MLRVGHVSCPVWTLPWANITLSHPVVPARLLPSMGAGRGCRKVGRHWSLVSLYTHDCLLALSLLSASLASLLSALTESLTKNQGVKAVRAPSPHLPTPGLCPPGPPPTARSAPPASPSRL